VRGDQDVPTLRQFKIPVVLVIGGSEALIGVVSEAALSAQVLVAECALEDATDTAAEMKPLVLIMGEATYSEDPEGFEALARDVRAKILRVLDSQLDAHVLEPLLTSRMVEAEAQRPSWNGDLATS
jgi:hypothetical protein